MPHSPSLSVIPFAWEEQPGIPKNPVQNHQKSSQLDPILIPLPPSLRPLPEKRPDNDKLDPNPFAVALAKCTMISSQPIKAAADEAVSNRPRRRRSRSFRLVVSHVRLFGSCKSAAGSVRETTVCVQRSSSSYGMLNLSS